MVVLRDIKIIISYLGLPKIFTPFYSRFSSGIGLGMAMVKRIIDEHSFEIDIRSQKDIGTEVTVCFKNQQKY